MGNGCSSEEENGDEVIEDMKQIPIARNTAVKEENEDEWTMGMVPLWGETWGYDTVDNIKSQ